MGNNPVEEVVQTAHAELLQLIKQRAQIVKRIGTIKQTIAGLADLYGDGILTENLAELIGRKVQNRKSGLTESCRKILMEARVPISAREVSARIEQRDPALLSQHKDPRVSVTTILNRLVEYGEAEVVPTDAGRRAWQWVSGDTNDATPPA